MIEFPAQSVPDNALFAPHHFLYAMYALLFICARKWDNHRRKEPLLVAGSAGFALFGWWHIWRYYPKAGASVVLLGTVGTILAALWSEKYDQRWRLASICCGLVALDDAVSHAFGIWTPLDWLWQVLLATF